MDNISKAERSYVMGLVRSKDTRPEVIVRKFLHSEGFRYRLHVKSLPGRPDIVLKKYKTVIQIHGCFWHGHKSKKCKLARTPKSNVEFWINKIRYNRLRDQKNKRALINSGWKVIEVWECELRDRRKYELLLSKILC